LFNRSTALHIITCPCSVCAPSDVFSAKMHQNRWEVSVESNPLVGWVGGGNTCIATFVSPSALDSCPVPTQWKIRSRAAGMPMSQSCANGQRHSRLMWQFTITHRRQLYNF